ncbi:MAG: excision repair protein [Thermoplasmata archaeon]|jgi:DNA excision repair protein ERCC-2|nr:excision repair protein [Thermoplasmata archaeon]
MADAPPRAAVFCPTCRSLLQRRMVRGRPVAFCPQCDGVGSDSKPLAWFTKKGNGPDRSSEAAKVAASVRPQVHASVKRAKPGAEEPRRPRDLPPPTKLEVPPGMDLFPFGEVREGQRQFLADVAEAVAQKRHLLAHAPTGLGKTVSTLAPLVKYALEHEKRVFFLTSKQSQHKIAVDTLKAIRQKAGVPFVVADVIGKQDMCPRPEARDMFSKRFAEFCRREQVTKSCEYWETGNAPAIKILRQRPHHVEELVIVSTECTVCPHQAALDLAAQAHVVVCDYNYFFSDLRAQMQERMKVDLENVLLVVDEAHNLPDRIRDHLTLTLSDYVLDDAIDEANDLEDEALKRSIEVLRLVLSDLAEIEPPEEPDRISRHERFVAREELVQAVNDAFGKKRSTLTIQDYDGLVEDVETARAEYETEYKDDSRGLAELHEFLVNWRNERRGLARILTREPTPSLAYKILDAAVLAKPVFDAVHASVVMSGTLHPLEMTRDVLGLDPARSTLREYASPFPRENRLVLVDGSVTTGYKERTPQMWRDIATRLAQIAEATPGNVAAFFPSYAIMDQVREHVEAALDTGKQVVVEERGADKAAKEAMVNVLRRGVANALLLGVQGGSLSEGYDYEDNLLKAVVIVGLPFAQPSLEVEALTAYYEKKFGVGMGRPYAYVHPTFHRVLQGAGRCIRGPNDRGVIALLDKRFGWGSYRSSYPPDFNPKPTDDLVGEVKRFWSRRA